MALFRQIFWDTLSGTPERGLTGPRTTLEQARHMYREDLAGPNPLTYPISFAICCLLMALPFLAVEILPITDLPQQIGQIRLLSDSLDQSESEYVIQGWHPNKLGYLPLALAWLAAPPMLAARLGMLLIALAWAAAPHLLARQTGRQPAAAALACLLFFSHVAYWGLLNFLMGLPAFALFYLAAKRRGRKSWLWLMLASVLLYWAHILWLAAGLLWLLVEGLRRRLQAREWLQRGLALLPVIAASMLWYPTLARAEFDSATVWGPNFFERLDLGWLVSALFGGLQGSVEELLGCALLAWSLLGLWQNRRRLREKSQPDFLLLAALFATLALALPAVHQGTVLFASRWLPMAGVFALLGLPAPRLRSGVQLSLACLLLFALSSTTARVWEQFEEEELSGLSQVVADLPAGQRVLGLDMVLMSPRIRAFPFYHLYAYGQVVKGGTLNRSFANFASSLVVFHDMPRENPWTYGLDWQARNLRQSDIPYFDYLIVLGDSSVHQLFSRDPKLRPVNPVGRWRLYQVRPEEGSR
jgi:hypothetical protein